MGLQCLRSNHYRDALDIFKVLVEDENDKSFEALHGYARALRANGIVKKSADLYQSAITVNGEHAQCRFEYGQLLLQALRSKFKAISVQYAKCLELSKETHHECMSQYAALLGAKKKKEESEKYHKKAIAVCKKALKATPDDTALERK